MSDIVLLYDRDCPNAPAARENLLRAFVEVGASPRWLEVDRAAEDTPEPWRGYGSPTILIDGADALGAEATGAGATCRLYRDGEAFAGVPSVSALASAIAPAGTGSLPPSGTAWGRLLTAAPGVGAALLPKVACPACWPAYAGLLSALGLGFLMEARYLLPLTVAFLALALGAIGWRARTRRGFGPLLLGVAASFVLLVGKFALESEAAMWTGVVALVAASTWNAWPRRASRIDSLNGCSACAPRTDAASHPRGA